MIVKGSTPLYALLGNPARHSLSPLLHNHWIKEHGFDGVYVALQVEPTQFEVTLNGLFYAGVQGLNVTSPFKERAATAAISLTGSAQATASVNCLTPGIGGFAGDSTDGAGFIADLDARAAGWRDKSGHVLVIGAGGAARAILYALDQAGCSTIHLVNRNHQRAWDTARVATQNQVIVGQWEAMDASVSGASLVINATSAGMNNQNPLDIDLSKSASDCLVYDTIYAPRRTALIVAAQAQKRETLDGLGMLIGQGALAFHSWFGVHPDMTSAMRYLETVLAS
jgi:shikimate dehydrogenase